MNARRVFCLTVGANGGYLFALFPPRRMDRDQTLLARQPSLEFSPPRSASERLNQRRLLSTLARLARSTRGRVGAALLALAGTGAAAREANAATIMMQGEIVPAADVTEQPEYALALTNDNVWYSIGHADGTRNSTLKWFGFEAAPDSPYALDRYVHHGSDVPSTVVAPNAVSEDGIHSRFFLTIADVPELSTLQYGFDTDKLDASGNDVDPQANLCNILERARVWGYFGGSLSGSPQSIQEAIEMSDNGTLVVADYSENVQQLNDARIFRSVREQEYTPEPSTLVLAVGAAIAGVGLVSRRRLRESLQEQG